MSYQTVLLVISLSIMTGRSNLRNYVSLIGRHSRPY